MGGMAEDPREVMTLDAARAQRITRHGVANRVRRGEWQRVFPRVYATYSGVISLETTLAAVLAYAGEGAVLSHETAAARHRLNVVASVIHVTVPACRRVAIQDGVRFHYSRRLPASAVRTVRGLPCTSVERTVIDLVTGARTPGAAAALIVDAVACRRTTADRLRQAAAVAPPTRYASVFTEVLDEAAAGAHSMLELRHALVCRSHGLPVGERQKRQKVNGKVTYIDNIIVGFEIVTELDGLRGHDTADDHFRDNWRDNINVTLGRVPLRHGWRDMLDRPCVVAQQRLLVLRARGWHGPVIECGPGCVVAHPIEAVET
ncbi:hypothetical protein acdb102_27790 [Acidothermaceae bacterium B102]|nr:hypothetical protein acdb102_27790 [Acidothermaceae bacterium B102]